MVYDNTKLDAAYAAWIDQNITIGFGEHYAGDLLDDFSEFLFETGMMKRSPGRVVFGKLMQNHGGFERRRMSGLVYWAGLKLNKARITKPKRYRKTATIDQQEARERKIIAMQEQAMESPEARKERLALFQAEIESETEEKLRSVENDANL